MTKADATEVKKEGGRYRKVEVRMWGDLKFRRLSPVPPSGQGLWMFLLTGPHTGAIPGLFRAGRAGMAEELGWDQEAFDKAFQEVSDQGMAIADWKGRLVWLPKAVEHNKPESPNVVRGWRTEINLLPECELKLRALEGIRAHLCTLTSSYVEAFDEVAGAVLQALRRRDFGKPSEKASEKAMANQEQEQEQEQDEDNTHTSSSSREASAPTHVGRVCMALKRAGIGDVNPGHPDLLVLLQAGATDAEFTGAAAEAVRRGKGFAYTLGIVTQQRQRAAQMATTLHQGAMPAQQPTAAEQRVLQAVPGLAAPHLRPVPTTKSIDAEVTDVTPRILG